MVKVRNLVNRSFFTLAFTAAASRRPTFFLDHYPRDSHSRVSSHLNGSQATTLVAFLTQFRGPICDRSESAHMCEKLHIYNIYLEADRPLYSISSVDNGKKLEARSRAHSPRMPPNKKMSNRSPSSGPRSLEAEGSSRHTFSFLSA